MISEKSLSEIKKRSQSLRYLITLDDDTKISEIQSLLSSLKDDDDPYYLGHLYALLINSYIHMNDSAQVVFYTNKLILISGMALYEYCGKFCPFTEKKIKILLKYYEIEENAGNYIQMWGKGRLLQLQNKYDEAIDFYEKLLAKQPDNLNAYRMCARVYEEINNYKKASEYFSKAEDISSDPLTLCFKANIEIKQYNFEKAQAILLDAMHTFPDFSIAKYRLIHVLDSLNKKDELKNIRNQLLNENPANVKYILYTITEFNKDSKIELEQIQKIIGNNYDYTPIKKFIGDYYLQNKKESRASCFYGEAIKTNPFCEFAYYYRISILTKKTRSALNENFSTINKRNKLIQTYHLLFPYSIDFYCAFKYAGESLEEQVKSYKKEIIKNPYNIELYSKLIDLYFLMDSEKYKSDILALCEETHQKFDTSFVVNYRNFIICRDLQEYEKAESYITRCVELSDQNTEIKVIAATVKYYRNPDAYSDFIKEDEIRYEKSLDYTFYLELAIFYFNLSYLHNNSVDYSTCSLELIEKSIQKNSTVLNSPEHQLVYSLLLINNNKEERAYEIYTSKSKKKYGLIEQIRVCGDIFDINLLYKLFKVKYKNDISSEIRFWTFLLLHLLQYNLFNDQDYRINHYTSLAALNAMLSDKGMSPFRLCSLGSANDPKEGRIIYDFLVDGIMDKDSYLKIVNSQPTAYTAVQASFTKLEDALTMFRLYGKKDKNEGTGVNLVFNENFFSRKIKTPLCESEKKIKSKITVNQVLVNDEAENRQEPLYWILYWDRQNKMYFNPQGIYKTLEIDLTHNTDWYILNNEQDEFKNSPDAFYEKYAKNISFVLNKLKESFVNYFNNKDNLSNLDAVKKTLLNISYLIKDASFYDEKELRIIKVEEVLGNETLKHDDSSFTLYKDYAKLPGFYRYPKSCVLDKIIIGPKVEQKDTLREYLLNHLDKADMKSVKVEISQAPLA